MTAPLSSFRRYLQPLIDGCADVERQAATALGAQMVTGNDMPTELEVKVRDIGALALDLRERLIAYRQSLPHPNKLEESPT